MVIVGAGECGVRAAFALRDHGHAGSVTLVGAEAHLPYERPPLSKPAEGEMARPIADEERYRQAGITLLRGTAATAIDRPRRRVVLSDGSALAYDRLLLATGSRPRPLGFAAGSPHVLSLRTLDDARAFLARCVSGSRLAIVGAGFIGLEAAALARRHGMRVSVIEARPRIAMRGVAAQIAARLHARHVAAGVEIFCDAAIETINGRGLALVLQLAGGAAIEADFVLAGIGVVPETGLAEQAGLAIDNGIAVDATLATSDPAIFAAGDCCSFPLALYGNRRVRLESWRNAQEQGALAARNMLGAAQAHAAVPWFWSDQYELGLQVAGLPETGSHTVCRDLPDGAVILFHLDETGRLMAASGLGPGNAVARDIRLAGMLIAARRVCDPARLADPGSRLKALLAA